MKFKTLPIRMAAILAVVALFFSVLSISPAYADSAGPRHAGLGESIGLGTALWVNPNNIVSPGAPYTNAAVPDGGSTNYLQATQYGFTIPSGSRIDRITVAINRRSSAPTIGEPLIRDQVVQLVKGGVPGGTNKAATGSDWPTSYGVATYGGIADPDPLWGSTWTAEEINAADFGVVLAAMDPADILFGHTAFVDYIQITVTYVPGTSTTVDCGSGNPVITFGSNITCVATVTRLAGGNTPSGDVAWITSGAATFTTSPCTLAPGVPGTAS
jgi:hypothetical protein